MCVCVCVCVCDERMHMRFDNEIALFKLCVIVDYFRFC